MPLYTPPAAVSGITTAQLAANAVTQIGSAVGSSVSPSTTSATYADMPDMSVALTTGGGDLLVWFDGVLNYGATGVTGTVALSLDGAAEVAEAGYQTGSTSQINAHATSHRFTGVAAGAHTVKVRWKSNGSASLNNSVRQRRLTVLEVKR